MQDSLMPRGSTKHALNPRGLTGSLWAGHRRACNGLFADHGLGFVGSNKRKKTVSNLGVHFNPDTNY